MSSGPHALSLLLCAMLGFVFVPTAQAKSAKTSQPQVIPPASSAAASASEPPWLQVEITPLEKEIVQQHSVDIRKRQRKKPASGKALPPGWQKKIARSEVLPPAVYAQAQPLPDVVRRKLPPPPTGTVLVIIDGKLVRLLETTHMILDVVELK